MGLDLNMLDVLKEQLRKKAVQLIRNVMKIAEVVIYLAPSRPTKRPNIPATSALIKGKNTINKYISI